MEEEFSEETKYPEFLSVYQTLECADYLYLTVQKGIKYGQNRDMRRIVYNKSSEKLIRVEGIKNDLDGGVVFWPQKVINGKMLAFVEAIDLINYYQQHRADDGISEEFKSLVNSLSIESTPVLVVVK